MKIPKPSRNGPAANPKADTATLGEFIQSRREELGLSLRALASRAGIAHSFVSALERDMAFASQDVLVRLAEALEVPVQELLSRDTRLPLEDLSRLADRNPRFRVALRTAIQQVRDGHLSLDDLSTRIEGD